MNARLAMLVVFAMTGGANASPLFDEEAVLDIELSGPLSVIAENTDERQEQSFVLTANGVSHEVKVRIRGKSRLTVCNFLPLRLNFNNEDTAQSVFEGQDKIKLVTHCYYDERGEEDVLEEFAAYRILNLLSDVSYRVRLLRITYSDTGDKHADVPAQHIGFAIESADELAARTGGKEIEVPHVTRSALESEHAALVYVYQYLIGNTDWSLVAPVDDVCCHNGDLFDIGGEVFYVPYDFDLSGLVNARHAKPDPSLRLKRVTQRRYRGYCTDTDSLRKALQSIKAKRADILDVIKEVPSLSEKDVSTAIRFLDRFFEQADDEEKLLRSFEKHCL